MWVRGLQLRAGIWREKAASNGYRIAGTVSGTSGGGASDDASSSSSPASQESPPMQPRDSLRYAGRERPMRTLTPLQKRQKEEEAGMPGAPAAEAVVAGEAGASCADGVYTPGAHQFHPTASTDAQVRVVVIVVVVVVVVVVSIRHQLLL